MFADDVVALHGFVSKKDCFFCIVDVAIMNGVRFTLLGKAD